VKVLLQRCSIAMLCVAIASVAQAKEFPERAITLIIPFSAGGVTDQVSRLVAVKAADNLGVPVVIENRPGGGGQIAISGVRQAAADGHTLLVGDIGTHAINVSLYSKLSYDPVKDFIPVTELVEMPHVLVVPADSPYKSIEDLVAGARAKPGSLTYGSVGIGSGAHLLGEMLKSLKGIEIVHLPYRGSSQIVPDLMSNRIALFFGAVGSMAPLIESGQLRALVVTDSERAPLLPTVASAKEAGIPGLDLKVWFGILAPAGTPDDAVHKLNVEFVKALSDPLIKQRLTEWGGRIIGNDPGEFAKVIASETERLGKVVKSSGARLD